jgi:hypothetical protein
VSEFMVEIKGTILILRWGAYEAPNPARRNVLHRTRTEVTVSSTSRTTFPRMRLN